MKQGLFMPRDGAEESIFFAAWCSGCSKDKVMNGQISLDEAKDADLCPIVAKYYQATAGVDVELPEWVYAEGRPTCAAHSEFVTPGALSEAEKAAQRGLF